MRRRGIEAIVLCAGLSCASCVRVSIPGHDPDVAGRDLTGRDLAGRDLAGPDRAQPDLRRREAADPAEVCNGLDDNNNGWVDEGGVCPPFCVGRTRSGHVYLFCSHQETFAQAHSCCAGFGMKLVRVDSAAEEQWLIAEGQTLWGTPDDVWLGGTDAAQEGTWRWEDGAVFYKAGQPVLYSAWKPSQPSDGAGENCLSICTGAGWNDINCALQTVHVCEKY